MLQHMRAALVCAMAALGAADEIGSRMQYCDTTPAQREQMLTSARAALRDADEFVGGRRGTFAAFGGHFPGANPETNCACR